MIIVHHLENSRSQRVLWLLEELGLPYNVVAYKRTKSQLAPPELKAIHPLGKSPVIVDDGRVVAETGAIIDYLLGVYGDGRLVPPAGTQARLDYTYWMYAAEGSFMTPLLLSLIAQGIRKRTPWPVKPVGSSIASSLEKMLINGPMQANLDYWEAALSKTPWFAGEDFTAADVMMSFPVEAARARTGKLPKHVAGWLNAIHGRPAYARALARGGPYAYA